MGALRVQGAVVFGQLRRCINVGGGEEPSTHPSHPHTGQPGKITLRAFPSYEQLLLSELSAYSFNELLNEGDLLF